MNRAGILDTIKSLLVVVPVTVLIWLLAESESLRIEKLRVEVVFASADQSNRTIHVAPGQDFRNEVSVQIEGPNARVDALVSKLRGTIRLEPGMPGVPLDTGLQPVDLQAAISNHPLLRESRVSVTEVEPGSVKVQIDTVVTKDARVRLELPPDTTLEGAAEVTPPIVKVRLPESSVRLLESWGTGVGGSGGEPEVVARLDRASVQGLAEGRRAVINAVPIELPPGLKELDAVVVTPSQVSVSFTPRSRITSWTTPNVPVHVRLSATELDRWSIEIAPEDRVLKEVTISGPSDAVEQLKKGGTRLIGFVPLGFEDLEKAAALNQGAGGTIEREPVFTDTPSSLRFETRQRTIHITVKRRDPKN